MRDQRDLGEVLDGFHVHVGVEQVNAVGHHAMVRHEDGIVVGNQRRERLGQFRRAGSFVVGQRHRAQGHDEFRAQARDPAPVRLRRSRWRWEDGHARRRRRRGACRRSAGAWRFRWRRRARRSASFPCGSTMTRSSVSIRPLLISVGVLRMLPFSRRTDRLPSVAATRPVWCSNLPKRTISSRCCCSVFMR